MDLTTKQLGVITDTVNDLYYKFAARLLGRWFKGPTLYFSVVVASDPGNTLESLFRYTSQILYGPGVAIDDDVIRHLSDITANYIEAERLKTINRIAAEVKASDTFKEFEERVVSQIKRATSYVNMLSVSEGRFVQAHAEKEGIAQLGASIGVDDPTVVFFGVNDSRRCKYCRRMYSDPSNPRRPIPYKLSQLQSGYFKPKEWDGVTPHASPLHPHCFSDDTEVLTAAGWKLFRHALPTDQYLSVNIFDGHMEYVPAVRSIAYRYSGNLYHFSGNTVDLLVTDGHSHPIYHRTMLCRNGKQTRTYNAKFVTSLDLMKGNHEQHLIKRGGAWHGIADDIVIDGRLYKRTDLAIFCGYWLSEGYVVRASTNTYRVYICQQKYSNQMWSELKRIFPHKHVTRTSTKISFSLHNTLDRELLAMLLSQGHSFQKYIPNTIKESCVLTIRHFLDAFRLGDGSFRSRNKLPGQRRSSIERVYHTSSSQLASDIGELILKTGKSPSYTAPPLPQPIRFRNGVYTATHTCWCIRENNGGNVKVAGLKRALKPYDGWVYDVELARNHTLFVRRNGKVILSGNCRCVMSMVPPNFTVDGNGTIKFHSLGYDYYSDYHGINKSEPIIPAVTDFSDYSSYIDYHSNGLCECECTAEVLRHGA